MKTNLNLTNAEKSVVTANINNVKYLNLEAIKNNYDGLSDETCKEILRKLTNILTCANIINMYINNDNIKEDFNVIISDIIAELE